MRIALDHDGTYTKDPDLWDIFIERAQVAGHEVICVTMRGPSFPVSFHSDIVHIYYTKGVPKAEFMKSKGIKVDIWIDDDPWLIHHPPERF